MRFQLLPFVLPLALPLALTGSLPGQGTINLQDVLELPSLATGDLDHALVVLNDNGDAFAAWQGEDAATGRHQVEGVLIRRASGLTWTVPQPADVLLLGDPSHAVFSSGEECNKPDVVSLGQDFAVVWARNEPNTGWSQLEVARILVPPAGPPVVDSAAPGLGWTVDPLVVGGDAGLMPDLAARAAAPGEVAVAYAHETYSQAAIREYDLRATTIDLNASPPQIGPIVTLAGPIPVDNTAYGPVGGRVLPDMVEDDFGHLVIAYESFELAVHNGLAGDEGHVHVHRFAESGGIWTELEHVVLDGQNLGFRQRRPNLATSHTDLGNTVSLAWIEQGLRLFADLDVRYGELEFLGGAGPGTVAVTHQPFPNLANRDHAHPAPIHARAFRAVVCCRWYTLKTGIVAFNAAPPIPERPLPTNVNWAWRPAADLIEIGQPGAPDSRLIAISYEGDSLSGSGQAIFVQFFRR
ncbi:MAG: hypothetical protein D6702_00265 [Planctomycetota bacterium]|nr:MAG: hypothetical protein D6702_00265 [Planctomycetota bacterium]